jgi:hypothetical protein
VMADPWVDLADAIEGLRSALTEAINQGAAQGMQFEVAPIELTVQTVLKTDASGKVGWKVVEVGGSVESAATQTLKLSLTPVWKRQDGTLVRDFTIADVMAAGQLEDRVGPRDQDTIDSRG